MNTLFEFDPVTPPGFFYKDNFISGEEEDTLLDIIRKFDLHPMIFQGYIAKRKVASFGFDWNFENRQLTTGKPIPPEFIPVIKKVAAVAGIQPSGFGELLITEYPVGSVINWHRDAPPFDIIAGVSLLSDCNFRFRPYEKTLQKRNKIIARVVKRRSLYILQEESRTDWEHSISAVKEKRYSLTFRSLKIQST